LMSCGLRHFALRASSYQLWSGPRASAQPGRSQNFFRLLLAITLIAISSISHFGSLYKEARFLGFFASFDQKLRVTAASHRAKIA
jgi:hypothetical protein